MINRDLMDEINRIKDLMMDEINRIEDRMIEFKREEYDRDKETCLALNEYWHEIERLTTAVRQIQAALHLPQLADDADEDAKGDNEMTIAERQLEDGSAELAYLEEKYPPPE